MDSGSMGLLRWAWRRVRCKTIVLATVVLIFCTFCYLYVTNTCSDAESQRFIKQLCDDYHNKQIAGSLCAKLCDTHRLRYDQCTNYPRGKVVLFMTCDGCESDTTTRAVLKSHSRRDEAELIPQSPPPSAPESDDEESWERYINLIQTIIRVHFSVDLNDSIPQYKDVASFAWGYDFLQFTAKGRTDKQSSSQVAFQSIMSLLQQSEYLLSRYLQGQSYIPKIYGTCGNTYFVEYTETLGRYDFDFGFGGSSSWRERAKIALKLIEMVRHLESDYKRPLHLCDVKADNFGMGGYSRLTVVDTDCAFFDEQLMKQFRYSNCSSHTDCDFFDCRGFCDTTAGKCLLERTNNNMQSLCEDVFQGFSPKLPSGLLRDPPADIRQDLYDALEACAYPDNHLERHATRQRTPDIAVKKLEEIIRFGLKYN